jgi:hypothetical protein
VEIGLPTFPDAGTAASLTTVHMNRSSFALLACVDAHVFDGRMQQIGSHDPMLRRSAFTMLPGWTDAVSLMLLLQRHTKTLGLANRRLAAATTMEA